MITAISILWATVKILILAALGLYALTLLTWACYLATMSLRRERDNLSPFAKAMAYQLLPGFYLHDVLFNLTVGTIFFRELPREMLFTARCDRWLKDESWRGEEARWWCTNYLDPFDQNHKHCRAD